jgi:hypothetical protein
MGGSKIAASVPPYQFKIRIEYVTKFSVFGRVINPYPTNVENRVSS